MSKMVKDDIFVVVLIHLEGETTIQEEAEHYNHFIDILEEDCDAR